MGLKEKTLSGLAWTFSQQFGVQGINFMVSIVLARLLMPEEFGLIGMISVFIALGTALVDSGLTSSLIRTNDADQRDFSTVFFMNLFGSLLIYAILYVSAPLIADFFNQEILTAITRVYCLSFIIGAFSAVQNTILTKKMDFRTQMTITIPSLIVGSIVGLLMAFKGYGVWSLVYMNLTQSFLSSLQLWIRAGWRPSWVFDVERLKYHFNFGYKMTLAGILDTFYRNIYRIIIGRYFSAAQLGFYTRAQSLKQLPVQNISTALNKVTYPMFSHVQDDDIKLKSLYKRLMQQVLFWVAPTMVFSGVLAEPLFRFLLTEKWLPAVPYFQILCYVGIMYPLHSYNLNILKVKGRSDLFLKLEIIKKAMVTIGLFIAVPFGIFGLLWMQVVLTNLSFLINTYYSGKLIGYNALDQVKDILPILGLAMFAGAFTYVINAQLPDVIYFDLPRLVIGFSMGMLIYLLISYFSKMNALLDFRQLVLKR